jgi:hypothetical protein
VAADDEESDDVAVDCQVRHAGDHLLAAEDVLLCRFLALPDLGLWLLGTAVRHHASKSHCEIFTFDEYARGGKYLRGCFLVDILPLYNSGLQ